MTVTTKLKLDLQKTDLIPVVNAVQNDRYSRVLEISLFAGGELWPVPTGAQVSVSYSKPDGRGGEYDTLPDGTRAWSASDNVLTVTLAPQMLTAVGVVSMAVTISQGDLQISTFPIALTVTQKTSQEDSADYYAVARFLPSPQTARKGQFLRIAAVDGNGRVTAMEAVDAPAGGTGGGSYTLTEEDKQEIVEEVLASLPAAEGVGF